MGVVFSGSAGSLAMLARQQSEGLADSLGAGRAAGGGRGKRRKFKTKKPCCFRRESDMTLVSLVR